MSRVNPLDPLGLNKKEREERERALKEAEERRKRNTPTPGT